MERAGQEKPAGQGVDAPPATVGCGQKLLTAHAVPPVTVCDPVLRQYPAVHTCGRPVPGQKKPAGHVIAAEVPPGQKLPAGHAVQLADAVRAVDAEKVLMGHGVGIVVPAAGPQK